MRGECRIRASGPATIHNMCYRTYSIYWICIKIDTVRSGNNAFKFQVILPQMKYVGRCEFRSGLRCRLDNPSEVPISLHTQRGIWRVHRVHRRSRFLPHDVLSEELKRSVLINVQTLACRFANYLAHIFLIIWHTCHRGRAVGHPAGLS